MGDDIQDYNLHGLQKDRLATAGSAKTFFKRKKSETDSMQIIRENNNFSHVISKD